MLLCSNFYADMEPAVRLFSNRIPVIAWQWQSYVPQSVVRETAGRSLTIAA